MHALAAQLLKAHPDIGLDVLDQMADMDVPVGVRQRTRDQKPARHGARSLAFASVLALASWARPCAADDAWFGPDKALHFGFSLALSAGGYAASSSFVHEPWQRAIVGSAFALSLGAAKEGYDALSGGDPSWRDFAWDAAGTTVGVGIAFSIDSLWLYSASEPRQ